jgi:small subunit ribosomal protein S16
LVKIRMKRMGMRHRPTYRIVVTDVRRSRDGEYLESLGHYDPRTKLLELDMERARHWLAHGAQPTETAGKLIRRFERELQAPPPELPTPTELAEEAAAAVGIAPVPPDAAAERADEAQAPAEMAATSGIDPEEPPATTTPDTGTEPEPADQGGPDEAAD